MATLGHDERMHRGSITDVTSGISSTAEYNRTIGALFSFYWLMRIGIDGERGFAFGVEILKDSAKKPW